MAVSPIKKKGSTCIQIQGALTTPATLGASGRGAIINGLSLSSAFSTIQLGYIPTGMKLVGVVPIWATGTVEIVFTQGYVDDNENVIVSAWNTATASRTITNVRLLTFWE